MMQQPPAHPMGLMGSVPPANITTEQIQKYLDENKQLILAILDNQNLGRLDECAEYQAQLQKNLLYLAAIADAQPQAPAMRPQMIPHAAVPQAGGQYVQQAPGFPHRAQLQFTPQQVQELQQQQQSQHQPQMMPFAGHMGMRPLGGMNGMNAAAHTDPSHGRGNNEAPSGGPGMSETPPGSTPSSSVDRRGSKQYADGHKNTSTEQGSGDAEPSSYPRRPEDSNTP